MSNLRIYIWQGGGISSAYHDDGTLVICASSPQEARQVALDAREAYNKWGADWTARRELLAKNLGVPVSHMWQTPEGKALWKERDGHGEPWDGELSAIEREPDEVVELDNPKFVSFNGGGYD